jgi:hypothetical protein
MMETETDNEKEKEKKLAHALKILKFLKKHQDKDDEVLIKFADGSATAPWILLASLSPLMSDYLHFVDKSTIKEAMVILPDLSLEDYLTFTK